MKNWKATYTVDDLRRVQSARSTYGYHVASDDALAQLLADERAATIERCARECDRYDTIDADGIAARIRALK
jgi:hypothetical protein